MLRSKISFGFKRLIQYVCTLYEKWCTLFNKINKKLTFCFCSEMVLHLKERRKIKYSWERWNTNQYTKQKYSLYKTRNQHKTHE